MRSKIITLIFLIILLICLTGCSNVNVEVEENDNKNGYYIYVPVFNGKFTSIIPIWYEEVENEK